METDHRKVGRHVWAELVVEHEPSDREAEFKLLVAVFDESDDNALANSVNFAQASWQDQMLYSRELASYRILCLRDGNNELVSYIEVRRGNILDACQSAWTKLKRALGSLNPRLGTLDLIDPSSGAPFLSARTVDFKSEIRKRESITPLVVGLATVFYLVIAINTFARHDRLKFAQGAVAGVMGATVALFIIGVEIHKGRLRWGERGPK